MQQYADIYSKVTLHVSGVTAPIIRSIKTVNAASGRVILSVQQHPSNVV